MRSYKTYEYEDTHIVENMLKALADKSTDAKSYQDAFFFIGRELGHVLKAELPDDYQSSTLLACASEDTDWLAKGLLDGISAPQLPIAVFWSKRYSLSSGVEIAPITMSYQDDMVGICKNLIIVKSIISSSCVVKTQLLRLISTIMPEKIFIVAPVMFIGAEKNLSNEFPKEISDKFLFITFAIDDEQNGREIIPGIGGMVYDRLGLGGESRKNQYIPRLVQERMKI